MLPWVLILSGCEASGPVRRAAAAAFRWPPRGSPSCGGGCRCLSGGPRGGRLLGGGVPSAVPLRSGGPRGGRLCAVASAGAFRVAPEGVAFWAVASGQGSRLGAPWVLRGAPGLRRGAPVGLRRAPVVLRSACLQIPVRGRLAAPPRGFGSVGPVVRLAAPPRGFGSVGPWGGPSGCPSEEGRLGGPGRRAAGYIASPRRGGGAGCFGGSASPRGGGLTSAPGGAAG
jgi:hypothetical protein